MDVHGGRDAAVLVPVFEADGLHAVFTRRRHDLRRHAGEISFPGGRRDHGEELVDTALREAHEEIGLPPDAVDVVGALPPTPTFVTNYAIYPFVGVIEPGLRVGAPAHRGRRGARAAARRPRAPATASGGWCGGASPSAPTYESAATSSGERPRGSSESCSAADVSIGTLTMLPHSVHEPS